MESNFNITEGLAEEFDVGPFFSDHYKSWKTISRVTASISMVSSAYIIVDLIRHRRVKLLATDTMTNRIIFGASFYDVLYSFVCWFLFSWPFPEGIAAGAAGNTATCTTQGFFTQVAIIGSVLFNVTLSACYVLMVKYGWNAHRLNKFRHAFLTLPVLASVMFAIPPLFDGAYNFNVFTCYLAPKPHTCDPSTSTCERGNNYQSFVTMSLCVTFTAGIINLLSVIALYQFVLQKEKRVLKYSASGSDRTLSKRVAVQGIFYFFAFALAWWNYYYFFIFRMVAPTSPIPLWLNYTVVFFCPLQGLFNAIVFLRPRIQKQGRELMKRRNSATTEQTISSTARNQNEDTISSKARNLCEDFAIDFSETAQIPEEIAAAHSSLEQSTGP